MADKRAVGALRAANQHNTEAGFRRKLVILCVLVIVVLAVGGAIYIGSRQADLRTAAHEQLSAIADLKLRQISTWREERLDDARFFSRARFAARDVRRFLEEPDSVSRRSEVLHWLSLLKGSDRYYAAMIYDTQLKCRLAIPDQESESIEEVRALRERALQDDNVIMSDLHRDQPGGSIRLDIFFPIFEEAELKRAAPIAFVLLKLDSRKFLFPLVQSWPTPSPTAETLLVRREGNDVL